MKRPPPTDYKGSTGKEFLGGSKEQPASFLHPFGADFARIVYLPVHRQRRKIIKEAVGDHRPDSLLYLCDLLKSAP